MLEEGVFFVMNGSFGILDKELESIIIFFLFCIKGKEKRKIVACILVVRRK